MPNHEDYVWYKEHGICPTCRHAKASPGRVLCDECLEKNVKGTESGTRTKTGHKLTPTRKNAEND